ncbi:MAG TPA: biotin/lipoyl-containing protein [Solirubrobacteraceae bacterium]|nr:biotin/lipoyl-containing protein [Solirubrobacteraceae bacterium]
MQVHAGCALPEEYLYHLEFDVWVRLEDDGSARIGMTDVAQARCGKLVSVSFQKQPGAEVRQGRTLVVIESAKWVGPFRSPLSGTVVEINDEGFHRDPLIANRDPYGAGWFVRLVPTQFEQEAGALLDGLAAFPIVREQIERDGISCMRCAD